MWEPGGAVIWEDCKAGVSSALKAGFLAGWWMQLFCARLVPVPVGWGSSHSTWSCSQARPAGWEESDGWEESNEWGSVCPTCSLGSAGPDRQWAWGRGLVFQQAMGPAVGWGAAWTGGRDHSGPGSYDVAEMQIFLCGVGPGAGG
jgi:hypothetical protein